MKLSVSERIVLLNILPKEGDITTLRIVRELRDALSFSEEEHGALQFKELEGGGTEWNPDGVSDRPVEIGPRAFTLISEALEKLNKNQKLVEDYVSVWDKFCEGAQLEVVSA